MKSLNALKWIAQAFRALFTPLHIVPYAGQPNVGQLQDFSTFVNGPLEYTRGVLYDTVAYAQAGQTLLTLFQNPVGQSSKTMADTNMTNAGMLPSPTGFLIQTVELYFYPGAAIVPAAIGASAAAEFVNDTYKFFKYGAYLKLTIGQKDYLVEAPLQKFPPRNGLSGFAALSDTTTAGATQSARVTYASGGGPVYEVNPPIFIAPTVNFSVTLNWPTVQAISAAGTVMCSMSGYYYRKPQ